MPKNKKLIDKRFGLLVVLEDAGKSKHRKTILKCQCDCGNTTIVQKTDLCAGKTRSCGCLRGGTPHGMSHTPEYSIWTHMIQRCTNKNSLVYKYYGARGITVCDRWRNSFEAFYKDMGSRPNRELTIDRIDNNGNYEKSNCRWVTRSKQSQNTNNYRSNKTGVRGVRWHKDCKKYQASITTKNKTKHLGLFPTIKEAAEARRLAEIKLWNKEVKKCE